MKKIIILLFFIFTYFGLTPKGVFSDETPEWIKRIELSYQYETDKKPTFYFQTVQPFFQSEDKTETIFYQPRASLRDNYFMYNFGVGYRKIVDEGLLLGGNLFADYQDRHGHFRLGLGAEALGQILEARLNAYFGISTKRIVESSGGSITYERIADGLDFELGAPIPHLPWLKFYSSGFWYDFDKFSDKIGWKTRLEAKPNEVITLEFYTWDDNKGDIELGGRIRCNIPFDNFADIKETVLDMTDEAFPRKDLTKETLIPVERSFDITVEKWVESGTATIQISRGNN